VYSAAFSPDGARIVTALLDGTARIWDVHFEMMSNRLVVVDDGAVEVALGGVRDFVLAIVFSSRIFPINGRNSHTGCRRGWRRLPPSAPRSWQPPIARRHAPAGRRLRISRSGRDSWYYQALGARLAASGWLMQAAGLPTQTHPGGRLPPTASKGNRNQ
jgi:hypothetical protein